MQTNMPGSVPGTTLTELTPIRQAPTCQASTITTPSSGQPSRLYSSFSNLDTSEFSDYNMSDVLEDVRDNDQDQQ